jgi:hypothetical protein
VQPPIRDDDPARDRDDRAPAPSARVQLEVDLLASEQPVSLPDPVPGDHHTRNVVLVVAGDSDVRRYVCECVRDRADLLVLEASTIAMATRLASVHSVKLLIVDASPPDVQVLDRLVNIRAVLLGNDVPQPEISGERITALARPFGAQDLQALVDRLVP